MERMLLEYLVNSLWQAPLLALGAWLALRAGRPGPRVQHGVWVGTLALIVALPLLSLRGIAAEGVAAPIAVSVAAVPEIETAVVQDVSSAGAPRPLMATASGPSSDTNASASWLRMREVRLSPEATHRVVELYLAVVAFAMLRLLWSWMVARRMVAEATPAELTEAESVLLDACCERLRARRPRVLVSARTVSPLVVGVLRPALLLPEGLAGPAAHDGRELEAVWWHELAHVRRRDYLANLLCRIWALPVAYHPATYVVERRVRRTREMVCDGMAAAEMQSPVRYARCLVGLAQRMQAAHAMTEQMHGAAMFDGGILEERVMELIGTKATMSLRMRAARLAGSVAMLLGVLCAAATFHVTPTMAQDGAAALRAQSLALLIAAKSTVAPEPVAAEFAEMLPMERIVPVPIAAAGAEAQAPQPAEPQIRLKVRFASYDRTLARQLGVNLFSPGASNSFGSVTTQQFPPPSSTCLHAAVASPAVATVSDPLDLLISRPDLNLGATIEALQAEQVVQVLSEPKLLIANGKEGSFLAGGQYPFPVFQGTTGPCAVTIQFKEFGVRLNFIPTITPRGSIRLQVAPEVSSLDFANEVTTAGFTVPGIGVRKAKTEVELSPGQGFAIGGLLDSRSTANFSKMRLVSDIPVLGKFFQSVNASKTDTELIAIVTPEIVEPAPVGAIRVPPGSMAPNLIFRPDPIYPAIAKAAHVQGAVVLDAVISKEGTVQRLNTLSGPSMLQGSAMEAVRRWTYKPYLLNGAPVEVETTITVYFTFGDGAAPAGGGTVPVADGGSSVVSPLSVPSGTMQGSLLDRPDPIYPPIAKAAHVQGAVVLDAVISKEGTVESLHVVDGPSMLQGSALEAVRHWTYKPYLLNGAPTEVETTITVNFTFGGAFLQLPYTGSDGAEAMAKRSGITSGMATGTLIARTDPLSLPFARSGYLVGEASTRSPGASQAAKTRSPDSASAATGGQDRELTQVEREKMEKELAAAKQQLLDATQKLNNPEFRKQIEDAQRQAKEAAERQNTPEFRKLFEDAQREAATLTGPGIQKQFAEAQKQMKEAMEQMNTPEFRQQLADAQKAAARMNSPEMRTQMEELREKAKELEKQMQDMRAEPPHPETPKN